MALDLPFAYISRDVRRVLPVFGAILFPFETYVDPINKNIYE